MCQSAKKYRFTLLTVLTLLVCWLVFKADVVAQQVADPNFNASVAHPAYTTTAPPVLFDEAHLNFHTTQGRYKPFVDLISNDGYQVVPNRQAFQAETLADYDILVIANASSQQEGQPAFREDECNVVRAWVSSGGSLLLIADHKPFGAAAENLASRFGVEMSNKFTVDLSHYDQASGVPSFLLFSRENGLLAEHPIVQGRNSVEQINQIKTFTGQSLSVPSEGQALLQLSASAIDLDDRLRSAADFRAGQGMSVAHRAQGVALPFGQGRVVILGEAAMISAQLIQSSDGTFLMGMNHPGIDNRQFALNLMHWLSRLLS
ncbi:DUF4350 domain-containing protein [Leptolyngbya sp. NK1-12]|uniref:DUF4350 domain-containing protein n=1 Tax=Leptolyngbya sp. NK1-12 TaxID=2547451 RepID=A0AA96WG96_9CYAN|nr:hypothetical protein [Leptolyngbya sp. NK1-12]WNZ25567.1 DUF4350 domain-containing protein [Leptolyngbya sp. NK1-12]